MKRMRNGVTPSGKGKSSPDKSKIVLLLQYLIHFAEQIRRNLERAFAWSQCDAPV